MSKPSKLADDTPPRLGSGDSSTLDVVEAAKAKQNSLLERLAARRQKTKNLLAAIGKSGTKPLISSTRLSSNVSAGSIKTSSACKPPKSTLGADVLKKKESANLGSPLAAIASTSDHAKDIQTIDSTPLISAEKSLSAACGSDTTDHHDSSTAHLESPNPAQIVNDTPTSDHISLSSASTTITTTAITNLKKSESDPVKPSKIRKLATSSKIQSTKSDPTGAKDKSSIREDKSTTQSIGHKPTTNSDSQNSKFELEDLLGAQTAREKENKRVREEIMELLNRPTTKERSLNAKFRSQGGSQVKQFCSYGTRIECSKQKARSGNRERCTKLHFRKIIHPHTDESLGDCSFLNTCFHVDTCKYVHYTIDYTDYVPSGSTNRNSSNRSQTQTDDRQSSLGNRPSSNRSSGAKTNDPNGTTKPSDSTSDKPPSLGSSNNSGSGAGVMETVQSDKENGTPLNLYPPQWINCDIRQINMSILGKFSVIMADPPWDIHMELPYGTMSDDEMRRLDIPCLQDDGYLFLWVTGRAMELGRECLRLWGYQRVDEIIWVKTNQLQRLIRTGRTGHWLNHGKEHCLVGVKGNPQSVNRGLDCDIIVSEVRETSHKPDEIYGIIERLSPGTRKLELFGRPHNLQPNWITLGNQLDGTYLVDPAVVERFKKQYPNGIETKTK